MANPDKSSDAREEQPENISYMPCTFEVSKEDRSREVRDEQSENILPIPVTFEVSNEERSREARDEQPENIPRMPPAENEPSFTFDVSNDERSSFASFEQPENISLMFVTLDVSRAERSTDLSDEQLQNISPMSVTLDVSSPERSADVKLRQAANILAVVFALTPWRILTVVNELLLQGPPSEEYHLASSPDVEPDLGLIVGCAFIFSAVILPRQFRISVGAVCSESTISRVSTSALAFIRHLGCVGWLTRIPRFFRLRFFGRHQRAERYSQNSSQK